MFKNLKRNKEVKKMGDTVSGVTSSSGTTSTTSSSSNTTISQNEFLQLLTIQLKNQNPLSPYDDMQFASQLAQFSQLEQLIGIKSLLEDQATSNTTLATTISNSALPGLIGKTATATTDTISYNGTDSATLGYSLSSSATSGELLIKNSSGTTIKTVDLSSSELSSGDHTYTWDGTDASGNQLASGDYTFEVNAYTSSGSQLTSDTYISGTIEAVRFKSTGTMLVIDGTEVPLEDITDIAASN
jgi:flagellar basal-body rod modification protein FlgD